MDWGHTERPSGSHTQRTSMQPRPPAADGPRVRPGSQQVVRISVSPTCTPLPAPPERVGLAWGEQSQNQACSLTPEPGLLSYPRTRPALPPQNQACSPTPPHSAPVGREVKGLDSSLHTANPIPSLNLLAEEKKNKNIKSDIRLRL